MLRTPFLIVALAATAGAQNSWCPLEDAGFGDPGNELTSLAIEYGGDLYIGTLNAGGAELWRWNGTWQQIPMPLSPDNFALITGVVHQGELVVGTLNTTAGAEVWSFDGAAWTQLGAAGLGGGAAALSVDRLATFGTELVAGLTNASSGTQIRALQGGVWNQVNVDGFGCGPDNEEAYGLIEYAGKLYATTGNDDGCQVWEWDGVGPWQRVDPGAAACLPGGFGAGGAQTGAHALEVVGSPPALWVGTEHAAGAQVWRYDGAWTQLATGGFGNAANFIVHDFAELGGLVYASTENSATGCEIWAYDTAWTRVDPAGGFGAGAANEIAFELGVHAGRLIATTLNGSQGGGVWRLALGQVYCTGLANSTGLAGALCVEGSEQASANDAMLIAHRLPPSQFGFFLNSMSTGLVSMPGSSQGNLCLSGAIGRYNASIFNSGPGGAAALTLDLTLTPTPTGPVSISAGQTWNFQAWYRDNNPGPTSNFTDAVGVTFL